MNMRTKVTEKEMLDFARELVDSHAEWDGDQYIVNWYRVPEDDRNELISKMVDHDGFDFSTITENDDKYREDILAKLVKMLKSGDTDADLDFAESVKKAAHHYFEDKAIEMIDELAGEYTHDTLAEHGLCLRQDRNHGDFVVCRI